MSKRPFRGTYGRPEKQVIPATSEEQSIDSLFEMPAFQRIGKAIQGEMTKEQEWFASRLADTFDSVTSDLNADEVVGYHLEDVQQDVVDELRQQLKTDVECAIDAMAEHPAFKKLVRDYVSDMAHKALEIE